MSTIRAAILVRLSQADPRAAAHEVDSVHVQVAEGRRSGAEMGWSCEDRHIFVDDGVSGAECLKRPGLTACFAAAERKEFDVAVVRDMARLSRAEAARAIWLLVELQTRGVRVWSWANRRFCETSGSGFILTAVDAVQSEEYRRTIGRDVKRALRTRTEKGFAVTHATFGYGLVRDAEGRPWWQIDPNQMAIVIHIGETFVACGGSLTATAMRLNVEGVSSPRGSTWRAQTVANLLRQPLYRGVLQWGRERKVHDGPTGKRVRAPAGEVLQVQHPELKIWPDPLLARIRRASRRDAREAA